MNTIAIIEGSNSAWARDTIMQLWRFVLLLTAASFVALPRPLMAETYYVDSINGADSNSGTSGTDAFRSVSRINSLSLDPSDAVLFRRSQSFDGTLDMSASGTSSGRIQIGAWGSGSDPVLYGVDMTGSFIVVENLTIDHRKEATDAVRLRGAENCILRNLVIRNGTRDAVDVDGGDGLLVEDTEIHHFLNGSFGSGDDSHGFAVTDTQGITIRRVNVHHVSGDSLQVDPNRSPGQISDNILIEDSTLWTGPLNEDFNAGWQAGDSPGENAIDTKVLQSGYANEIRMSLTLRNVVAHGWTSIPQISNRAAFNLKEKVTVLVDRVTVFDSEIAFRVRGALGNADTLIANAVIYDVDVAIRAEDDLSNLQVFNTTFGHSIGEHLRLAGGGGGVDSWDWRNNAFIGSKPSQASHASNRVASNSDFVNSSARDYSLAASSPLIDAGVTIAAVTADRNGNPRTGQYDVGAHEYGNVTKRPKPPILTIEQ